MQSEHLSLNLNYRAKTSYTSISLSQSFNDRTETYKYTIKTPKEECNGVNQTQLKNPYLSLKICNDWHIDSLNTIGFAFSVPLSYSTTKAPYKHNFSTLRQNDTLFLQSKEERLGKNNLLQHSLNLNFTHIFSARLNQELNIGICYNRHNLFTKQLHRNQSIFFEETQQQLSNITNIGSVNFDFQTDFWRTGKVECGGKWLTTHTNYKSTTNYLSANFKYSENIGALYLIIGKSFKEKWDIMLGVRGEYTHSVGRWEKEDSISKKNYFNLFPSIRLGYTPTKNWTIQRPHYTMLDPSLIQEDTHTQRRGNPNLMPGLSNNLLISFGYSEYVSLDFDFTHTKNIIDYKTKVLSGGHRIATATNYGQSIAHNIYLSLTEVPIVPKLTPKSNGKRQLNGAWLALTAIVGGGYEKIRSYDNTLNTKHWKFDIYMQS